MGITTNACQSARALTLQDFLVESGWEPLHRFGASVRAVAANLNRLYRAIDNWLRVLGIAEGSERYEYVMSRVRADWLDASRPFGDITELGDQDVRDYLTELFESDIAS